EARYRAALGLDPAYAQAHLNLGLVLLEGGRKPEADSSFRSALAHDPALSEARLQLSRLLFETNPQEALDLLHEAAAGRPASSDVLGELGDMHRTLGHHDDAVDWYRKALKHDPANARRRVNLGHCLSKLNRFDEAQRAFHTALEHEPALAEAHYNIGLSLQFIGRFDDAIVAHERAVALRPDLTEAHFSLAMIRRARGGESEITHLGDLLADSELSLDGRIHANFALARLHDNLGDEESAFAHYRTGNELKAQTVAFDPARHADFVDRCIATFDHAFFGQREGFGLDSHKPVFILGMPRSGTTLVEQILSAHREVHGAGELDDLRLMIKALPDRLGSAERFPDIAPALGRPASRELARDYLSRIEDLDPGAARITDKMTGNYLRLGLIALILPRATIIHCRRDPLDTCLSCYFQNFANGLNFTYDLGHLGAVYRHYARLMAHWREVLPLRTLDVCYEDLVAQPEGVSRDIVAFCGLDWDDRCLDFHRHERQVRTASFWQVRQPIFATSVGRWRKFSRFLGPLFESLDMAEGGPA
ncbi:MAG: sulfotransferase, partial [Proteobacteria bacterium]|nr:sulfotransferase [Pseudomonadota bacterium]